MIAHTQSVESPVTPRRPSSPFHVASRIVSRQCGANPSKAADDPDEAAAAADVGEGENDRDDEEKEEEEEAEEEDDEHEDGEQDDEEGE
jgi:hypothetical protein